jgi:hypothetical protein
MVPAPRTAARRGCQILSRRWIPDLLDDAEAFVAGDEDVLAGGRGPVLAGVDLLVGAVEAKAQDAYEHPTAVRHVRHLGLRHLGQMGAVGLSGVTATAFMIVSLVVVRRNGRAWMRIAGRV